MFMGRCCNCGPFEYVNVKSFSASDGSFEWEHKALGCWVTPGYNVYLLQQREITASWLTSNIASFTALTNPSISPVIARPASNINTLWSTYDYTNIDEAITVDSGTEDGLYCEAIGPGDNNKAQQWALTHSYISGSAYIGAVRVFIKARKTVAGGSASVSLIRVRIGGAWYTANSITLTDTLQWFTCEVFKSSVGSFGNLALATSAPAVEIKASVPASGDNIEVETVYLELMPSDTTAGFLEPPKNTTPAGRYKKWAIDAVTVASDGTPTITATDVELFSIQKLPSYPDVVSRKGLPTQLPSPFNVFNPYPLPQKLRASDLGKVFCHMEADLQIFDSWKQSTTKKYRLRRGFVESEAGHTAEIILTRWNTQAVIQLNDDTTAITSALEGLEGVVSATVTGGPWPWKTVDIEIEWADSHYQFHHLGSQWITPFSTHELFAVYSLPDDEVIGYWDSNYTHMWTSDGEDTLTKEYADRFVGTPSEDEWAFIVRRTASVDADGLVYYSSVWSTPITTSSLDSTMNPGGYKIMWGGHARDGVILCVNSVRMNFPSSSHKYFYFIVNETTGAGPSPSLHEDTTYASTGDVGLSQLRTAFISSTGKHILTGTPAAGLPWTNQTWLMPSAPNELSPDAVKLIPRDDSTAYLLTEADDTYIWTGGYADGSSSTLFNGYLTNMRTSQTSTFVTGGDAFFPTHDYWRVETILLGISNRYKGSSMEWRFALGSTISGVFTGAYFSSWMDASADDTAVNTALAAMWGNNSAGLPAIQVQFSPSPDTGQNLAWFYRGGTLVWTVGRNGNTNDTSVDNLIPFGTSLVVELRNASVEIFKSLAKEEIATADVIWQRDIGVVAASGWTTSRSAHLRDTSIVCFGGYMKPLTHPTIVSGPLP